MLRQFYFSPASSLCSSSSHCTSIGMHSTFIQTYRRYTWLAMIKQFFCFNFLILVLLENSLQFMIFSIINIINVKIKL